MVASSVELMMFKYYNDLVCENLHNEEEYEDCIYMFLY